VKWRHDTLWAGMNWRVKSFIQRNCARLPFGSEAVYYRLQRAFGSLSRPGPFWEMLAATADMVSWLRDAGIPVDNTRIMEVGTGRRVDMPLGFHLCGAKSVDTYDSHLYLKSELVQQSLRILRENPENAIEILSRVANPEEIAGRLERLQSANDVASAMRASAVHYHAPTDAAATGLPASSIDVQISYTVFEHIPGPVLRDILTEARRILSPNGVVLHHIDLSDHFWHEDQSLSPIHFLQFSDKEWDHYANNQFAYHNRLRVTEYRQIFEDYGFKILRGEEKVHQAALESIKNGFPLNERFKGTASEALACVVFRALASPRR
jgi:SAM-dependent methyltransferase